LPEELTTMEGGSMSLKSVNQPEKKDNNEDDDSYVKSNGLKSHQGATTSISSSTCSHKSHRSINSTSSVYSSTSLSLASVRESIQQATQKRTADQFACSITLLEIMGLPNQENNITAHMLHISGNKGKNGNMIVIADVSLNGKIQSTSAIEVSSSTGRVKWNIDQDDENGKKVHVLKFVDSIRALRKPLLLSLHYVIPTGVPGNGQDVQDSNSLCCVEGDGDVDSWVGEKKLICTLNPISIQEAMKNGGIFEVSPENIDDKKMSDYKDIRIRGKVSMI